MKKTILIILVIMIIVSAASCSGGGEPYSTEALMSALRDTAESGETSVTLDFSGSLAADKPRIEEDIKAAVGSYEIGSLIKDLDVKYTSEGGHYSVDFNMTLSDREHPSSSSGMYSAEALDTALEDAVLKGEEEVALLFDSDVRHDAESVNGDIKKIQSSNVHIAYLTTLFVSTVYAYDDAVEIGVDITYRDDAVRDITDISDMEDIEIIHSMMDGFTSWDEKLAFYTDDAVDIKYLTGLATEAYANDCHDIVCEPTGIKTERYNADNGCITEVYLEITADRDECEKRAGEMRDRIKEEAEELKSKTEGMEEEDALKTVCSRITDLAVYAEDIAEKSKNAMTEEMFFDRTAYGTFISGRTVCTGYAYALKALCDELDIPCWVVFGKLYSGEDHAWNAVYLNGEVKYIDVTFMASGHSEYFLFDRALYSADSRADFPGWVMPF
ncbi:MAG: hypothetical protein IJH51_05465 [Christensenellaceae bacterium]|nr:hypothetical protein [Christensenellaceae bacterium]